jgi:malonate transporter
MTDIATIVLPVFGLIALGFACGSIGLFPKGTGQSLEMYLYRLALPVLLFNAMSKANLPDRPEWAVWIAYFTGLFAAWALAQIVLSLMGADKRVSVIAGFSAAFSNLVLIGIPLILAAFGEEGMVPLFIVISIHLPLLTLLGTLLIERDSGPLGPAMKRTLLSLARHPLLLGIVIGTAFNLAGLSLPGVVDQMVVWIAQSAAPLALVAMGLAVRRAGIGEVSSGVGVIVFAKLILFPAIVWVMTHMVFTLPEGWAAVLVIMAASSTGMNAYLFALPYSKAMPLAAASVTLSTVLAIFTISGWLWVVG